MRNLTSHRNVHGLDDEDIMRIAPSVFAEQPHHSRGEYYGFIPTSTVLQCMREEGFVPVYAAQSRTRIADKHEFTRHMLRFRSSALRVLEVGDSIPEIVLLNSHDGTSSYQISAGLFRLVCSNGMMVASGTVHDIRVRHTKRLVEDVIEGSFAVVKDVPNIVAGIADMQGIKLPQPAQQAFAHAAALLRWGQEERIPMPSQNLLASRRAADAGDDLWRTFNRVQENLVKGGLRAQTSNNRRTSTRGVNSVNADVKLNRDLWELAANVVSMFKEAA